MKQFITFLILLISFNSIAQEEKKNFFKEIYNDFLKYGTVYAAGNIETVSYTHLTLPTTPYV